MKTIFNIFPISYFEAKYFNYKNPFFYSIFEKYKHYLLIR